MAEEARKQYPNLSKKTQCEISSLSSTCLSKTRRDVMIKFVLKGTWYVKQIVKDLVYVLRMY